MASNYPAYQRSTFPSVHVNSAGTRGRLVAEINAAFGNYRRFGILGRQMAWVRTARRFERQNDLPEQDFGAFERRSCMNSPLDPEKEFIEEDRLFIYLSSDQARRCVTAQSLEPALRWGADHVIATTKAPYDWPAASAIRDRLYHSQGWDAVTSDDVKHFIAIPFTSAFENYGEIWTRRGGGPFDIVAYGAACFPSPVRAMRTRADVHAALRRSGPPPPASGWD